MAEGSGEEGPQHLKAVPLGMPGEIYVSGPTLGRGYLKRPDLNATRFPPRPASLPPLPKLLLPGQDASEPAIYNRICTRRMHPPAREASRSLHQREPPL